MLIELNNIQKTYVTKTGVTFRALSNISTGFESTGLVFLVGQSGSGKSTMLNVLGGLDKIDSGRLVIAGNDTKDMSASMFDAYRNTLVGFVFQDFSLIDTLSVYDNVKLALDLQSEKNNNRVEKVLSEMGIEDKSKNKVKNLSGGQKQRVAIARALVKDPKIILADEPTGSLDSATSVEVMGIFKKLSKERLVIVVTHDLQIATEYGDRILEMKDGKIYRDVRKRLGNEVFEEHNVNIISNTLVRIGKDVTLNDDDMGTINKIIKESGRKSYINVESDERKVKALFPNLREAVEQNSDTINTQEEISKQKYVPYQIKNHDSEKVTFKKGRLPIVQALKLGVINLNHKKGRLVLTILMSIIAFVLFGISQSFVSFNLNKALADTFVKEKINQVAILNSNSSNSRSIVIKDSELDKFNDEFDGIKFYKQYNKYFTMNNVQNNAESTFKGFTEIEDITDLGFNILAGKSKPASYKDVIISQYMARELIKGQIVPSGIVDVSEVIGCSIDLNNQRYIVSGIFESETEIYDKMSEQKRQERLYFDGNNILFQLYVKEGYKKYYINNLQEDNSRFLIKMNKKSYIPIYDERINSSQYETRIILPDTSEIVKGIKIDYSGVNNGNNILKNPNEIFISQKFYKNEMQDKNITIDQFNSSPDRSMLMLHETDYAYSSKDIVIKGIFSFSDNSNDSEYIINPPDIIMTQSLVDEVYENVIIAKQVLANVDKDADMHKLVSYVYNNGYKVNSYFTDGYTVMLVILSVANVVLIVLSLILSLLVVVLLFNFISTSIRMTKKQIGILRALGAKQSDTFAIYALEGVVVTLIALCITFLILAVGAPILNSLISVAYGFYFSLVSIGANVYFITLGLTAAVTLISIIVPLRKFSNITPIDAIYDK